jgi:hypothetical protein
MLPPAPCVVRTPGCVAGGVATQSDGWVRYPSVKELPCRLQVLGVAANLVRRQQGRQFPAAIAALSVCTPPRAASPGRCPGALLLPAALKPCRQQRNRRRGCAHLPTCIRCHALQQPVAALTPQERTAFEESTINSTDAEPCRPAGDGGQLCGIPIGYKGVPNRTGYYYLPKVLGPVNPLIVC